MSRLIQELEVVRSKYQVVNTNAIINGSAVDLSNYLDNNNTIKYIRDILTYTAGTLTIHSIDFSNDNTFTTGVVTMNNNDIQHFISANGEILTNLTQTNINATGINILYIHLLNKDKKYCRINEVSSGTANLTFSSYVEFEKKNINQIVYNN